MVFSDVLLPAATLILGIGGGYILGRSLRQPAVHDRQRKLIESGPSNISGRGMFALQNIPGGQIIERCPVLELGEDDVGGELVNYVFYGDDSSTRLVAMGNGMLFNHSSFPNVGYYLEDTPLGPELVLYTLRDVKEGEELFYNYGDEWWSSRDMSMKS
ncbi:SET domain-containing protein-lysine N-methyltransferase [Prosthecochloris sp. N3]|uniref:SET domain-containing protein-lysine N-methyltransferase n=1 Tax=Prosthecochloris ethylica TaxID=2743976 RepID=A0ABR9XTV7_9CHLB|nr:MULTISPECIES: SET domain-containing protein-lysine N-methyltransferase [Prosthecochloris]MBF0587281.1 SET domain-containing protein-lysine N-methyltransferase [Prosthecochloris ethylica]MBF0637497.1 SET domain-containing protein-lysine N-methyltransferase [Prosthecochloris ethylica]NUK48089.1 SET domain-containing protein-lysine N-methyltransferase [Prosthecochloris ethylica]RNA66088.1 SET domain-containing protein-lysine N-methyltransferase [Prosthecochloris sp. ZM_2]RNA66387.1 SET domain-